MSIFYHFTATLLLGTGLLLAGTVQAARWSGTLEDGSRVTVDPDTNRASIRRNGVETPLWDGVHRLQDGSTLIIRSGTVVPTPAILRARKLPEPPRQEPAEAPPGIPTGDSPCERLVQRVCGPGLACGDAPACDPAAQLLAMEQDQRRTSRHPGALTPASEQCLAADRDRAYFTTCRQDRAGPAP